MDDRLVDLVVRSNIALCTAACRTHGVDSIERAELWVTLAPPPAYYPNLITTDPAVTAQDVLAALEGVHGGGVKDSFATLDLAPHGFDLLFEAQWIYREAASPAYPLAMQWKTLTTEAELSSWREMRGSADSLLPDLLELDDFSVMQARDDNGGSAGALINLSGTIAGISNVFSAVASLQTVWWDLASVVSERFPGRALVGYERGDDLSAALEAGFRPVGPLRVWVRGS